MGAIMFFLCARANDGVHRQSGMYDEALSGARENLLKENQIA